MPPKYLQGLRQRRADLVKEGSTLFDAAAAENRGLNAAEAARDDAITAELTTLDGDIKRAEAGAERVRMQGDASTRRDENSAADELSASERGAKKGFASFGEQLQAVRRAAEPNAVADPRLYNAGPTGMSEGIGSDGGFLVQTDFTDVLVKNTFQGGELASRVRKIGIGPNSNGIKAHGVDENSRANGSRWGGVQSFWTAEAGLKRDSKPRFKIINMELDKLTGLCYVTDELLQDASALESWIDQAFSEEFVFKIEDSIMNGTGAGQPLGFLNSGATITVPKEAGQAAGTIVANNILQIWSRMTPAGRKNAVWIINPDIEPQLFTMMLFVKNVAGTENVGGLAFPAVNYIPPGVNGNSYGTLMGRPVIPVEYAAALGTAGDITLADLTQYLAIDKGPIQKASSIHVRFIYDETVFRFVYRYNGMPVVSKPMTPYRGTVTKSPFVTLASRL